MMVSLPATERLVGYVHRPGAVAERRRKLLESKVNSDFWERRGWPRKPPEIEGLANTGSWAVQHRGAGRSLRNRRTARERRQIRSPAIPRFRQARAIACGARGRAQSAATGSSAS